MIGLPKIGSWGLVCSLLLMFGCEKKGRSHQLVLLLERIEKRPIFVGPGLTFPDEEISLPAEAHPVSFRKFVLAYTDVLGMALVKRNNELHLRNQDEFYSIWEKSYERAWKKSQDDKRPILVVIDTTWCEPCHEFNIMAFREEILWKELQNYNLVRLTYHESETFSESAKALLPTGRPMVFPTFILLSGDRKKILDNASLRFEDIWGELFTFRKDI